MFFRVPYITRNNIRRLQSLPLSERKNFPAIACVYFVLKGSEILYIGQTADLFDRFRGHSKKVLFAESGCEKVAWFTVKGKHERPKVERDLIWRFKPVLNSEWRSRQYLLIEPKLKDQVIEKAAELQMTTNDLLRYALACIPADLRERVA